MDIQEIINLGAMTWACYIENQIPYSETKSVLVYEPRREKPGFLPLRTKAQMSCAVT